MVAPSATASENEKNGIPRLALTEPSIGSTTTRRVATRAERALAELLGDEDEVLLERRETLDDGVLGGLVDRSGVVSAVSASQHGLALDPRRKPLESLTDVGDAQPAGGEPVGHKSRGWKRRPDSGFGKKYVLLGGMRSPNRAAAKTSSTRGAVAGTRRPHPRDRRPRRLRRSATCTRCRRARNGPPARRRARPRARE